jgi:hypothetical protein
VLQSALYLNWNKCSIGKLQYAGSDPGKPEGETSEDLRKEALQLQHLLPQE